VDTNKEHLAVDEAQKLNIPVVAILDTNCDPDEITYPIPGNDDAIRSVTLLTRVVADAVAAGLQERHAKSTGGEKNVSAVDAEPLAEWEQELLKQSEVQSQDAPAEESVAAAEEKPAEEQSSEEKPAESAEAPASEVADEAPAAE
jgi:small subunit ribosomal protein S2